MSHAKIMIVEDEGIVALDIQDSLESLGYEVPAVVSSGEEALEVVCQAQPDLALMDIMLRGEMDGVETATQLREQFDVPVIYLTAFDDQKTLQRARITEPFGYLLKPFNERELHTTIEMALHKRQIEKALRRRNAILSAVSFAAERFLGASDWQENLQPLLARLGQATEVSHVYIFEADGAATPLLHGKWVRPGAKPSTDPDEATTWREVLSRGQSLCNRERETVHGGEGAIILKGTPSIAIVPIFVERAWWGCIGFADTAANREWSAAEMNALKAAAGTLGAAIQRTQLNREIQNLIEGLESKVAARTADIQAEKEKSDAILRNVGDAIAVLDLKARIQYANEAFSSLTGRTDSEIMDRPLEILIDETTPEFARQALKLALVEGEPWQGGIVVRRDDGRTYEAAMSLTPLHNDAKKITGFIASHRDISQWKDLERARAKFITNVSHELRTPVTNMQLYAELAQKAARPEKTEHYLQVIETQAARLGHLVQDILEMANLESGQVVTRWERVPLSRLIQKTVARFCNQAREAGLTLKSEPPPDDLPMVEGDPARLGQALDELLENAITFTPSGGHVTLRLDTAETEGQRWVTIAVRDTGPGISEEEQQKIFEPLYRGKLAESGHVPGTGLGLSIVEEIMRAHGGRVTVESTVEAGHESHASIQGSESCAETQGSESCAEAQGSTFTLWLRIARPLESESVERHSSQPRRKRPG